MKLALVYDRVNKIGGAERVLLALHEIWPQAPLYTAVYNQTTASWAHTFEVIPSFLQRFPLAKTHHEFYPWLTPSAFESFNFNQFDVVISVTSAEAKGIITRPGTLHICYCLTPTRYLWSGSAVYKTPLFVRPILSGLRVWDQMAAKRPDVYVAISQVVAKRIKKFYKEDSQIIYPPLDMDKWKMAADCQGREDEYFLIVSRLVPYKRIDLAIEAFNKLNVALKIAGTGVDEKKLRGMAKNNIEFLGQLTDEEILRYYQNCRAVIFPQEEDLGLVPLEAQACGKPVIAYRGGGALETIVEGETGEFFNPQDAARLLRTIENFEPNKYKPENCRKQAKRFDKIIFQRAFRQLVNDLWMKQ